MKNCDRNWACKHNWVGTWLWHLDKCSKCGLKRQQNSETKKVTFFRWKTWKCQIVTMRGLRRFLCSSSRKRRILHWRLMMRWRSCWICGSWITWVNCAENINGEKNESVWSCLPRNWSNCIEWKSVPRLQDRVVVCLSNKAGSWGVRRGGGEGFNLKWHHALIISNVWLAGSILTRDTQSFVIWIVFGMIYFCMSVAIGVKEGEK